MISNNSLSVEAWSLFELGDELEAIKVLAKMAGWHSLPDKHPMAIKKARVLRRYNYPELLNIPDQTRLEFALVTAWRSMLSTIFDFSYQSTNWGIKDYWVRDKTEPLAAVLGFDYSINVEMSAIIKKDSSKSRSKNSHHLAKPSFDGDYLGKWPILRTLPSLSLTARTVFVRAVRYVDRLTALVKITSIGDIRLPNLYLGLEELSKHGFLTLSLDSEQLLNELLTIDLMQLNFKELKRFANEHGVRIHGSKFELVKKIKDQVSETDIKDLFNSIDYIKYPGIYLSVYSDLDYVHVLISEIALFKKFIYSEILRIDNYLRWIENINDPLLETIKADIKPKQWTAQDDMKPWSGTWYDYTPNKGEIPSPLFPKEYQLVRDFWESKFDDALRVLVNNYHWDAYLYIFDAIKSCVSQDKLNEFRKKCEQEVFHVYYNIIMYYGTQRIRELGINIKKPQIKNCVECGRKFLEASIYPSTAKRLGYRIYFCWRCYKKALYGDGREKSSPMSKESMLQKLAELAEILERIPMANYMQRLKLATLTEDKQIQVVKHLLEMPSYEQYVETFGSWFKALASSGILGDDTYRSIYGYRCIASDGHECYSLAEKTIDDWLSAHDIPHEKEPKYPFHMALNPNSIKRADWKVKDIFIEYAGLLQKSEYFERIENKRELADELGLQVVIIEAEDLQNLNEKLDWLTSV